MKQKPCRFDEDLLKKAIGSPLNNDTINMIYNSCYKLIYTDIFFIVKNKEVAEELTNDTFLKAFESFETYTINDSFRAWLRRIGKNKAIDFIRSEKNDPYSVEIDNENSNVHLSGSNVTDKNISKSTMNQVLVDLHSQLRYYERDLFKRRYLEEKSYEDIVKELGISMSAVKGRLHNLKKKMIRLYSKHYDSVNSA